MKLRTQILLFLSLFGLVPLISAALINLPLVLGQVELFYHKAYLQNLRADFRDLDEHLASRHETVKLLAKVPDPGIVLGESEDDDAQMKVDLARARYTEWINQILQDQLDIIQIVFFDQSGQARFWLQRNQQSLQWEPTIESPRIPSRQLIDSTLSLKHRAVQISPINVAAGRGEKGPRQFMTLRMLSPLFQRLDEQPAAIGAVAITIDVGGIAQAYRKTLWVTQEGNYISREGASGLSPGAFDDFPGLKDIFDKEKLNLWQGPGSTQIIWVPLFLTEENQFLWVGRYVDPSPLASFRNALVTRVLGILFALAIIVWLTARWATRRVARFGQELTEGISRVLNKDDAVRFSWGGPKELHALGDNLTRLAETHARHNHALVEHARQLEESNKFKSQFLANVSHELRTPLNSILLLSKMLREEHSGLKEEQRQQANVIHEAGTDLRSLIDNILDLSRIEANQTTFSIDRINLKELIGGLIELMQPQFAAKHLYLRLQQDPDAPPTLETDSDKLRQILKNFLSNAVKFTAVGGVEIRVSVSNHPDMPVRISVADSGIGIPTEKQSEIFGAFKQADGSTSRKYGGTGLGLTISEQLAHLMGGDIELESTPGQGSIFSLLLPTTFDRDSVEPERLDDQAAEAPVSHTESPKEESPYCPRRDLSGHAVMLVSQDMQTLLELSGILDRFKVRVQAAGDAAEALDTLEEESTSLVFVDLMMPAPNGYATIKAIKGHTAYQQMPVIAMVNSPDEAAEKNVEPAVSDVLTRPFEAAELGACWIGTCPKRQARLSIHEEIRRL